VKTYYPTIGLEIHVELKTNSKMFCGCKNDPDEMRPNINICPICMGHPGTLPTANKKAIESIIKVGLALGSTIADFTEFDRKNYFYPDIPKGYQISQYKVPVVSGGSLNNFAITRIHIEEDTGLSKHDRGQYSLVDFNRAGIPLMELVTEPVLHSAKDSGDFSREFQLLLRTLGVSDANLEKGEMRVEPNISLSDDPNSFGTKVEVKNLNSFKSVERAIQYELARMEALYEAGRQNEIIQETRGWDEIKQSTFSQRSKESAHDYRYFPDPDLPKMNLHSAFDIEAMKKELPELPWEARTRLAGTIKNAELIELFAQNIELKKLFDAVQTKYPELAANYLSSSVQDGNIGHATIEAIGATIDMIGDGKITSTAGKTILGILIESGGDPELIAQEKGLLQVSDESSIIPIVQEVIKENEKIAADYKSGKEAAIQALVGQVMKKTKGATNPAVALKLLKDLL
jgi:aspartyl-tRNA(Asn)/glutamyl-tRNA(Gln) amidotransferase subunit B